MCCLICVHVISATSTICFDVLTIDFETEINMKPKRTREIRVGILLHFLHFSKTSVELRKLNLSGAQQGPFLPEGTAVFCQPNEN